MARVLIIEDERRISDLIKIYLEHDQHDVVQAFDGREGVRLASLEAPDLVILDLMLPGLHGRDACRAIRKTSTVPILMLTALDDARDVVEGLDVGADDYITKPFQPSVLMARVRAALRRAGGPAELIHEITAGDIELRTEEHSVTIAGEAVELRAKEFDLLRALIEAPQIVHTRENLLETVWGREYDVDTRTVDVHVNRLRSKISHSSAEIVTVRGVGYRLVVAEG
ncbi:MAG: response regulator transcription factor [Thermomicrobiales bacterium]